MSKTFTISDLSPQHGDEEEQESTTTLPQGGGDDVAPPNDDTTPWPRSPPSGPTSRTPTIYVKVNSILSMVDLNTNLNGMLPHAYYRCVIRCQRRQGPIEKELPWCKEERRRRRKEEKKKEEGKKRGEDPAGPGPGRPDPWPDHPVTGPADRAARRLRPVETGSQTGAIRKQSRGSGSPARSPSGPASGLDRVGRPQTRSDRPPDRISRVCLDQIFLGRLFLYLFDLRRPVTLYKCPGRPYLPFRQDLA